jgi:hypothetical protein
MNINAERERFLAEQEARFGEPIVSLALARVLAGPSLGSELVFLLVGASALYLLPSTRDPSVFGINIGTKKKAPDPEPLTLPRATVTGFQKLKPRSWWAALMSPQEVVEVEAAVETTPTTWRFQLVGGAETFVAEWRILWESAPGA